MHSTSGSLSQDLAYRLEEHWQGVFNDVSQPAQAVEGKQMLMHHCIINGFDFERYFGTGPNKAKRPGDCKLILVYNTCSTFHNNPGGHSWRKLMIDDRKESARVCWCECVSLCVGCYFLRIQIVFIGIWRVLSARCTKTRLPKRLPVKWNTTVIVLNVALFVKLFYFETPLRVYATSQTQIWQSAKPRWCVSACRAICSSSVNSNQGWKIYILDPIRDLFFLPTHMASMWIQNIWKRQDFCNAFIPCLQPRWWLSAVNSFGLEWAYTSF